MDFRHQGSNPQQTRGRTSFLGSLLSRFASLEHSKCGTGNLLEHKAANLHCGQTKGVWGIPLFPLSKLSGKTLSSIQGPIKRRQVHDHCLVQHCKDLQTKVPRRQVQGWSTSQPRYPYQVHLWSIHDQRVPNSYNFQSLTWQWSSKETWGRVKEGT